VLVARSSPTNRLLAQRQPVRCGAGRHSSYSGFLRRGNGTSRARPQGPAAFSTTDGPRVSGDRRGSARVIRAHPASAAAASREMPNPASIAKVRRRAGDKNTQPVRGPIGENGREGHPEGDRSAGGAQRRVRRWAPSDSTTRRPRASGRDKGRRPLRRSGYRRQRELQGTRSHSSRFMSLAARSSTSDTARTA